MNFDDKAIDWLTSLLAETAEAEIMPRFRRLEASDIRQKTSTIDLVTEADVNAERVITARLLEKYPDALVIGEEAHAADPTTLSGLSQADLAFVVDPVDGTLNFASGLPLFGVMLAVVVKGETVAGIIHDPVGKDFILAARGGGAHLRRMDGSTTPCRVAPGAPLSAMSGAVSWHTLNEPERSLLARNCARMHAHFNYRCAAHEYRLLSTGGGHFVVYTKLMPWDHLPGVLIHAEAGGHSALFDGSPYTTSTVGGAMLVAPDRESWNDIRRGLWAD